jgi:hypothetical protein
MDIDERKFLLMTSNRSNSLMNAVGGNTSFMRSLSKHAGCPSRALPKKSEPRKKKAGRDCSLPACKCRLSGRGITV